MDPMTRLDVLTALLRPGARLLVTQGDRGGLLVTVGGQGPGAVLRYRPATIDRDLDPTGAGDVFLAALLAATVRPALLGRGRRATGADLGFAAAAGALAVEAIGLAGVPDLEMVRARWRRERTQGSVVPTAATRVSSLDEDRFEPAASGDGGASG
jgi:sugar/nucleoside kinase (ribokinase family)